VAGFVVVLEFRTENENENAVLWSNQIFKPEI
jgi:hypothetical protein